MTSPRLYLPAGYPSMYLYCVEELGLSEQAAMKRIRAGRTARRFPAIFAALAAGRLHLSTVVLLTPYLTPDHADELLAAAAHRTRSELEQLLAQRFPRPDVPARLQAVAPTDLLSPGTVQAAAPAPRPKLAPLSPGRFVLQLTIGQGTHEKLRHAQALLSHRVPSRDLAAVLDLALDALVGRLETSKFAEANKPRPRRRRSSANQRYIPAHVKRAVWQRDGGRCTYVSEDGHRCPARKFLETLWNDGLAVVTSSCLREEKPTAVARGHLDRGLAPAAPEPHTRGARRERKRYHVRRDGRTQESDQRGDAAARTAPARRVAAGQRTSRDPATGEEAPARGAG